MGTGPDRELKGNMTDRDIETNVKTDDSCADSMTDRSTDMHVDMDPDAEMITTSDPKVDKDLESEADEEIPNASDDAEDVDEENEDLRFSDFPISENTVRALREMGYEHPTVVQRNTLTDALEKRDLIVLSKTGSGKTAAFGVPVVELILNGKARKAVVLAPTRELAVQVETELSKIAKYSKLRSVVVYGKHSMNVEVDKIEKGLDILVGTPGRILDHIDHGTFDPGAFDLVVLDEADRMLDMGFIDQVNKIIGFTSKKRTTFLFSATIPEEIVKLSAKYLNNPYTVELESDVKTVDEVEQYYYSVHRNEKRTRLYDILRHHRPESCIVFCNTRFEVDRVTDFLVGRGITAKSIHGANSQSLRLKFLNQFKAGEFRVLVATDVAARGLHIEGLELVINYNLPIEKDSYIHRIGRTGRAGKKGLALSLVQEGELFQLYTLEEHAGVMIEELPLPERRGGEQKRGREKRDLYGIAFKELSSYDPEAEEESDGKLWSSDQASAAKGKSRNKKKSKPKADQNEKKGEKQGENKDKTKNKNKNKNKNDNHKGKKSQDGADAKAAEEQSREVSPLRERGEEAQGSAASSDPAVKKKRRRRRKSGRKDGADSAGQVQTENPEKDRPKTGGSTKDNSPWRPRTDGSAAGAHSGASRDGANRENANREQSRSGHMPRKTTGGEERKTERRRAEALTEKEPAPKKRGLLGKIKNFFAKGGE